MNVKYFIAVIFSLAVCFFGCSMKEQHFKLSRFISPEICAGCHENIYSQWQGSMHNLSLKDTVFTEIADRGLAGLTDKDELAEAEVCQKCHTPVGYISGYPRKTSDDRSKIAEVPAEGIQCDYCHSIKSAQKTYNAKFIYDPGKGDEDPGTKRGPLKDAMSEYHKSEYSKLHTKSEICGTCHNVKHVVFGTALDTTYEEWLESPYSSKGTQCQDCHMYQRPGVPGTGSAERSDNPGEAASGGKKRNHVFTHYFVGGNSIIPGMNKDRARLDMAEERLKNAASISVSRKSGSEIAVSIINNGAGHSIPTGVADVRQVWLRVIVKDEKGKVIYKTGVQDSRGYIDEKAVVYRVVFGDGKGNVTGNIAKAREILSDRRLKAMKEHREVINIGDHKGKVRVSCALMYRSMPQKLADSLKSLKKMKIKSVVMCEADAEI